MNIPPSFKFSGDKNNAQLLKSQALQFYNFSINQAELGGISFLNKSLSFPDGSIITVTSRKDSNYQHRSGSINIYYPPGSININKKYIYMETGFISIDVITDPPLDGQGASVNYSIAVDTLLNTLGTDNTTTPDQAKTIVDIKKTDESILSGETLLTGFKSKSFIYPPQGTYDKVDPQASFLGKYKALLNVPPSVFSGKLRLLIQAMYGAQRYDIQQPTGLVTSSYLLTWNNHQLNPLFSGSVNTGLFTTPDYDYYLMQFGGSSATFIKLEFPNNVKDLHNALKAGKFNDGLPRKTSLKTRAEAYLLSQATIKQPSDNSITSYTSTFTLPNGVPLFYGWHWKWDGSEGEIVLHDWELSGSIATPVTRHVKMAITYTKALDGTISFTTTPTTLSNNLWTRPPGWIALLRPDQYTSQLFNELFGILYPPTGYSTPSSTSAFSDIPIYVIRNEVDATTLVTASQAITLRSDLEFIVSNPGGPRVEYPSEYYNTWTKQWSGYSGLVSIECGAVSKTGQYEQLRSEGWTKKTANSIYNAPSGAGSRTIGGSSNYYVTATDHLYNWLYTNGYTNSNTSAAVGVATGDMTTATNGSTVPVYYGVRYGSVGFSHYGKSSSSARNYEPSISFVIPFGSCETAIITNQQHKASESYTERYKAEITTQVILSEVITGYFDSPSGSWKMLSVVGSPPGSWWSPQTNPVTFDSITTVNTDETFSGSMDAVTESENVVIGTKLSEIYDYFNFSLVDPYVGHADYAVTSFTGSYRFETQYAGTTKKDWPLGTINTFGWA